MQSVFNSFDWASVITEAILVITAVAVLFGSAMLPKRFSLGVSIFAFAGMNFALLANLLFPTNSTLLLANMPTLSCLIIMCTIFSAQMSFWFFDKLNRAEVRNEFIATLMICATGLILFVRSNNLMLSFVALECATVCLYVMTAFNRNNSASLEASVKYLIAGGVSGAFLLMGIALLYGAGRLSGIDFLFFDNFSTGILNNLFRVGFIFILAGVFFKLAAFPFQFWAPDVYQGAPTPVSAFFAVASKAAGIAFLAKICVCLKFDSPELLVAKEQIFIVISAIAMLTIVVGNLGGLTQVRTKRLLAFSGISNAGYLLVLIAVILRSPNVLETIDVVLYFYLAAYMLANYILFFGVNQFATADDSMQSFADYRGLMRKSPASCLSMVVALASLAGIPPTAGFFGKVLILFLAWSAQLYWLLGVMILGSVISIYYYFAWMRVMFNKDEKTTTEFMPTLVSKQTVVLLAISLIVSSAVVVAFIGA